MPCPNGHHTTERDRFCAVCGADLAPAYAPYGPQPSSTPPWVVPAVAASGVVAVVAVLVAVFLAVSGPDPDVVAGGASTTTASVQTTTTTLPVTTAPTTPPTTAPTTSAPTTPPTTVRPPTTTRAVPVSGSCPAEVAAQSGDSAPEGLERFTTSGFVVTICWADGDYWYHGSDRTDGREIALPAGATSRGFEAWSGDVRYSVGVDALVVTDGGEVILDEDVIRHDELATTG